MNQAQALRTGKWVLAILVIAGALGLVLWNLQLIPRTSVPVSQMNEHQLEAYGQRVFRRFTIAPITDMEEPEEVVRILRDPVVDSQDPNQVPSDGDVQELLRLTGELLYMRYGQPSVDAYKRWRRGLGYRLEPTEYLIKAYTVPQDYEIIFGEPYPGDDRFEEVFDRFWEYGTGPERAGSRITGISMDPEARVVAFGRLSRENPGGWPIHDGELGIDLWRGRSGAELRNWWTPPGGEFRRWLNEVGSARCAIVSLICEFASGRRLPVHLRFVQDPASQQWWFVGMGVSNDVSQSVGTTEL